MRANSMIVFSTVFVTLAGNVLRAEDYLTDKGQLAHELKLVQTQSGFAGVTGVQYTIAVDGAWTSEKIFQQKLTLQDKGKLSADDLQKVAEILKKYDLAKLPAKAGKPPGANPNTISFEFGKAKATIVGQTPPMLDSKNPTESVESRFAGISKGVVELLKPAKEDR